MRTGFAGSLVLLLALSASDLAMAQHHHGHPGGAPHHGGAVAMAPGHPAGSSGGSVYIGGSNQYNTYYNSNYTSFWGSPGFYVGGYGFSPYRYGLGLYGGGFGPYVLPPLVLPAQTLFGPQPVQQLMGGNPVAAGGAGAGPILNPPLAADAAPRQRKVRVSNAETKARAGKFIDFGDALFGKQRFREALERYKLAAQQAPDMAEIYLRQGIAAVATGQYESAGRYFRRALKMDDWNAAHVQLDQLYGADRIAKESHLEALAMAVQGAGHDANLLFLLGMEFYFNAQPERATAFFMRAAQLGGNEDHLLDGFMPPPKPAPQPNANAGAAL